MMKEKKGFKGIRDLKITWKMLISSVVPVIILLIVWLLMVQCFNATKIGSKLYNEIMLSNALTADILPPPEYVIEPYLTALQFISAPDASKRDELLTYFKQLEETYNQRYDYWKDALVNKDDIKQVFLGDAYKAAESFFTIFHTEVEPAMKSGDTAAVKAAEEHLDQAYKTHRAAIDKTVALSSDWVAAVTKNAESTDKNSNTEILAVIIAAVFVSLLCSFVISRSMVNHIKYVSAVNRRIADGELSASIEDKYISSDEIGQLCRATSRILKRLNGYVGYIREITDALETMAGGNMHIALKRSYEGEFVSIKEALLRISRELGTTISAIRDSADRVNNGAEQIAGGAQTLAQASTEQSSSLEGIVRSITKVSGDASRNSDNIKIVTDLVESSGKGVLESDAHMSRLIIAMGDINTAANRISGIIKTIDDISFQTNILALNASIEAARAGTAGKGFSVVAEEVRLLANKSAEAASQTSDLITDAIQAITQGESATELTAGALRDVKAKTAEVEKTIREISTASKSQAVEIQAVKESLSQISGIVQQNSATAEESAAVSQQLSAQSESLRDIVGRFVLEDGGEMAALPYLLEDSFALR